MEELDIEECLRSSLHANEHARVAQGFVMLLSWVRSIDIDSCARCSQVSELFEAMQMGAYMRFEV